MSAEAILDALATKVGAITGIKRAYGSGASDATVAVMPDDIPDDPVALVIWEGFDLVGGSPERITHRFAVRIYAGRQSAGAAYKALMVFPTRFVAAFRTDSDLGGTCQLVQLVRGDTPVAEEVNGKPYLVLPLHLTALELTAQTYTV